MPQLSAREFPLKGIRSTTKDGKFWKFDSVSKPSWAESTTVSHEEVLGQYCQFTKAKVDLKKCFTDRGRETNCSCLSFLDGPESERKIRYCAEQKRLSDNRKKETLLQVNQWSPLWLLPQNPIIDGINENDLDDEDDIDDSEHSPELICVWAFCSLLNLKQRAYKRLTEMKSNKPQKKHGLFGNNNAGNGLADVYSDLHDYFEDLKSHADPLSTRLVRTHAGMETRADKEITCLPTHYSKLGLYKKWCI